jgi:hypothetical protein
MIALGVQAETIAATRTVTPQASAKAATTAPDSAFPASFRSITQAVPSSGQPSPPLVPLAKGTPLADQVPVPTGALAPRAAPMAVPMASPRSEEALSAKGIPPTKEVPTQGPAPLFHLGPHLSSAPQPTPARVAATTSPQARPTVGSTSAEQLLPEAAIPPNSAVAPSTADPIPPEGSKATIGEATPGNVRPSDGTPSNLKMTTKMTTDAQMTSDPKAATDTERTTNSMAARDAAVKVRQESGAETPTAKISTKKAGPSIPPQGGTGAGHGVAPRTSSVAPSSPSLEGVHDQGAPALVLTASGPQDTASGPQDGQRASHTAPLVATAAGALGTKPHESPGGAKASQARAALPAATTNSPAPATESGDTARDSASIAAPGSTPLPSAWSVPASLGAAGVHPEGDGLSALSPLSFAASTASLATGAASLEGLGAHHGASAASPMLQPAPGSSPGPNADLAEASSEPGATSFESHSTLVATPTTLEIGVARGADGWLKIRAETGSDGIRASLSTTSHGGQELLREQLPAINAFLQGEQIHASASVLERTPTPSGAGTMTAGGGTDRQLAQDGRNSGEQRQIPQAGEANRENLTDAQNGAEQAGTGMLFARGTGSFATPGSPGAMGSPGTMGSPGATGSGSWLSVLA